MKEATVFELKFPRRRPTAPLLAPSWLRRLWVKHLAGARPRCPVCCDPPYARLAVSVSVSPRAYQFRCVDCGWCSPWFDILADRRFIVISPAEMEQALGA